MTTISKEEIILLARMSKLEVSPEEIEQLQAQIGTVLNYAQRLITVAEHVEEPSTTTINVVREDVACCSEPEPLLAQAPEREGGFFEVPAIIEHN